MRKKLASCLFCCLLWGQTAQAWANEYVNWQGLSGYARFSPQGDQLIRVLDRSLEIWSVSKKERTHKLGVNEPLVDAQMTPDGKFLIAGSEEGVYTIWRTQDYRRVYQIQDRPLGNSHQPFSLSPDGSHLAVCKLTERSVNNQQVLEFYLHFWDVVTGKRVGRIFVSQIPNRLPGHLPVVSVAWHPLGRYLTTAMEWDEGGGKPTVNYIQVRDLWEGRWLYWVPGGPPAEYSQNGEYFAFLEPMSEKMRTSTGLHWQVKLWNTRVDRLKALPSARSLSAFSGLTLSPQANFLAYIVPISGVQKQVVIHSTRTLAIQAAYRVPESADSISISPDEKQIMVSSFSDPTFQVRIYPLKKN